MSFLAGLKKKNAEGQPDRCCEFMIDTQNSSRRRDLVMNDTRVIHAPCRDSRTTAGSEVKCAGFHERVADVEVVRVRLAQVSVARARRPFKRRKPLILTSSRVETSRTVKITKIKEVEVENFSERGRTHHRRDAHCRRHPWNARARGESR